VRRTTALLTAACLLAAAGCAKKATPNAVPTTAAPTSASASPTAVSVTLGAVFYQDTFADRSKGWPEKSTDLATYVVHSDYAVKQYTVTAKGAGTQVYPHPAFRGITREQLGDYAVEATLQTTLRLASTDAFGLTCRDLGGKRYVFTLGYDSLGHGTMPWTIAKQDDSGTHLLAEGTTPSGGSAFRVGASCVGGASGAAHLALRVNDVAVGQADDADAPLTQGLAGVYLYTKAGNSTINVLDFAVRSATAG
jgi:hypothetical protein